MPKISRAFLSHSSFDKDFVEGVYDTLGAARCVYDVKTFERNCDVVSQIRDGLADCDVYVLFLSAAALKSGWVTAELDIASELRLKWKIRSVLVFQLDETKWSDLPEWAQRYVVSCMPSPGHVALRIDDEIRSPSAEPPIFYGRDEDVRCAIERISELERVPAYLHLSGPVGIGRRTLASELYRSYFPGIANSHIRLPVSKVDDLLDIYVHALRYSSNWRARDYKEATDKFVALTTKQRSTELALLLRNISVAYRQVVIIDVGTSALTEDGKPQRWFSDLTTSLEVEDYPYVWFISQRYYDGGGLTKGLFLGVNPVDERWSALIFKVLIKKYGVFIPSRDEQARIETCIAGHPGLIVLIANHLRANPNYKPNKTHNSIVRVVNQTTGDILKEFVGDDENRARAIALFSEAGVLSYTEIQRIIESWAEFEGAAAALIDAGLVTRQGGDYSLVGYVQRAAEGYSTKYKPALSDIRRLLLEDLESLGEGSFVPIQLLNSKIVEHILDGRPLQGYVSSLILPSQLMRAAKRQYDAQNYNVSLKLARDAYDQSDKLSDHGKTEAWRLIGLSGIRAPDDSAFRFFCDEYLTAKKSAKINAIFHFGNGLKSRLDGNLRGALEWYKKIPQKYTDLHVYRERAYIYAFEHSFDEAYECITKAHELAFGNPYILDILAMVLLERGRIQKSSISIREIDDCLDQLAAADEREGTKFYNVRSAMREVIIDNDLTTLQQLFVDRKALPIAAKVALLSMLSLKGKNYQYDELRSELAKAFKEKKRPLAEMEVARIDIEHKCFNKQYDDARRLMRSNSDLFTQKCCDDLNRLFPRTK